MVRIDVKVAFVNRLEIYTKEEAVEIIRRFRIIATIASVYICIGAVSYHFIEDLRWLDAFYFPVVSLLTVGYGDFTPQTDFGKLFTIFYLIFGVGILASFVSIILKGAAAKRTIKKE